MQRERPRNVSTRVSADTVGMTPQTPTPSRQATTIRLHPELHAIVKTAAGSRAISVNAYIARALARQLTSDNVKGVDAAMSKRYDAEVARLSDIANSETDKLFGQ